MGHVLGQETSSAQQQNLNAVNEKIPCLLFQDKHRVQHYFGLPYLDQKVRKNTNAEKVMPCKSSENNGKPRVGSRACDDNELVKHMSKIPGFLQKVENENTIQEKALNFGVLGWKHLEKWKYTERMPGKLPKKTSSSGSSFPSASGPPKLSPNLRKQPSSHSRNPSLSYSGKQPMLHGSHSSSPQRQPPPPQCSHPTSPNEETNGSYQKEEKVVEYSNSRGKETCNQEYQATKSIRSSGQPNHFQQRVKSYDLSRSETNAYNSKTKGLEKEMMPEQEASSSSSMQRKHKLLSPDKISPEGKKSELRFGKVNLTSEFCPADLQNIELQAPEYFPEGSGSGSSQFTESSSSLDAQLSAVTVNILSDFFSPQELYSGEFSAEIPQSCPLPSSGVEPHNLLTSEAIDADICPSVVSVTSMSSEAKCSMMNEETARPSIQIGASSRKQSDAAERPAVKGRFPSPTRRFSFNLGRMSRSFSFKESSEVPQLSSTYASIKSGPMRPEVVPGMANFEKNQANVSTKGRSSPLRRLLDPLLKHKTTTETVRLQSGSSCSTNVSTMGAKAPSEDSKPNASTFQALLQLSFKNGLPFFKLVVENSKDILAAALKRLPTSEKNYPCMAYSFYSVHGIPKKSMNWINHGSKSKSCSLGYNIIGQMKISNYHLKVNTWDTSECDARECVLYGVDPAHVDRQMLQFVPNKEIAAIVITNSSKKANDGVLSDNNKMFEGTESQGKRNSNGTVVILPGGVHGIPIKGAPSSLISRWRSGGLCDCGGWDVGCKLRILADSGKNSNVLQESISSSIDHVNLYVQGGEQKSKPVFSLKPFSNEFYSIQLDASISLLEAFATSVAYVTCWKFPEMIDANSQLEEQHFQEASIGTDKRKTQNVFQEQLPAKYVTCPPLSPVGRI